MQRARRVVFSCLITATLMGATALAQSAVTAPTKIQAQPLAEALSTFAQQTGLQLIYLSEIATGQQSNGAPAGLPAPDTLTQLLDGTGLTFEFINDRTVRIYAVPTVRPASTPTSLNSFEHARDVMLAQAEPTPSRTSTQAAEAPAQSREESLQESVELGEVVVTGSHIRGVENNTVPLIVLDRAYIDSTGFSTTTRLIESLPQNFALINQSAGVILEAGVNNEQQGSSVNFRGMGQGTTLTLLNGRRMAPGYNSSAVDISALPLAAIERVEILTDGASALYGSDAVGGVINFVLRNDFEGGETQLRSGWADGVNEYRLSQVLGNAWDSGNALLSLDYYKRDLLLASDRDFVPNGSTIGSLLPQDRNYSAVFSGRQNLSEALGLFADGLYSQRDSQNRGRTDLNENFDVDNPQATATAGIDWHLGGDWQIQTAGSYARNKMGLLNSGVIRFDSLFELKAIQAKADGSVLSLPGGEVSMAIGADWRSESYHDSSVLASSGSTLRSNDSDQIVRSAFAEVYVPIVGAGNAMTGVKRLEMSLAGRFDDYSNFGSSVDPQVGIMWEPLGGLRLRGSHGSSYKAPNLTDFSTSGISAVAVAAFDPGVPGNRSNQLQLLGPDVTGLSPQESESTSFGVEFVPQSIQALRLGFNYYRIEYTGRIASPGRATQMLNNPAAFGSLIIRNPTPAQVAEAIAFGQLGQGLIVINIPNFTPALLNVIVDRRIRNLSVTNTSGLDLSVHYDFDVAGGNIQLGLDGTHIHELVQQVTSTSAPADKVDTIYNPPNWRMRGSAGWQRQSWAANLFVNYTDAYTDDRTPTLVPISSYTTVDARLAYDFKERSGSFLSGLTVSANVQNLFDQSPPSTGIVVIGGFDMGFDPTNASPLGRLVAIELTKRWQ